MSSALTLSPFAAGPLDGGLYHTALSLLQPHLYKYIEQRRTQPLKKRTFKHHLVADDSSVLLAIKHDPGEALRYMLDHFSLGKYTGVDEQLVQWCMRLRHLVYHHDPSPVLTASNILPPICQLARQLQCPDVALQIEQLLADSQKLWGGKLIDGKENKQHLQENYSSPFQVQICCLLPWDGLLEPYKYKTGNIGLASSAPAYNRPQYNYCYIGEIVAILATGNATPTEPVFTCLDTFGQTANVICTGPCVVSASEWQVGHTVALLNAGRFDALDGAVGQRRLVTVQSRQHMLQLPCKPEVLRELSENLGDVLSRAEHGECCNVECYQTMDHAAADVEGQHYHCSTCRHAFYCSAECQQIDLPRHVSWCPVLPAYRTLMSINYATMAPQTFADASEANVHESLRQLYTSHERHAECCAGWLQLGS